MRVMIVSCSYLLYEYLLKLKKNCPRPSPRPRGFVLVLGLVLRSLASINITVFYRTWPISLLSLPKTLGNWTTSRPTLLQCLMQKSKFITSVALSYYLLQ